MSGRIAIINPNGNITTSAKFTDNMDPIVFGKRIVKLLENTNDSNDFIYTIMDFSFAHDKVSNEDVFSMVSGDWYNTCHDYENKWNCDYIYIKNLTTATRYFVTPDGFVALPPEEILTLHLGGLLEEDDDRLVNINIGDIVTVADIEWIVLKKTDNSVYCLTKDFINNMKFDDETPNYAESSILTYLRNFAQTIKDKIGEDALISREIDLTTNESKTIYGSITDDIGLLTEVEYKEFESVIKEYPVKDWWWLATADSRWDYAVRCVVRGGSLVNLSCNHDTGVRPFCIFSSKIF